MFKIKIRPKPFEIPKVFHGDMIIDNNDLVYYVHIATYNEKEELENLTVKLLSDDGRNTGKLFEWNLENPFRQVSFFVGEV
jgi:hypothetical protein